MCLAKAAVIDSTSLCAVPVVEFVQREYTVSEGDGEAVVCLIIDRPATFPIVAKLFDTPGTAKGMYNYIFLAHDYVRRNM